jgi:sugar/nucleoside kinase (ribokinase family)
MTVLGTGKRTFFHNKGANALLAPDDFDFGGVQASILHLGYLMLLDELDRPDGRNPSLPRAAGVLSAAQQSGILTSLDMVTEISPRIHEVVRPALPFVDYFIANETESGALAECAARDDSGRLIPANLNTIADTLLRMGVRRLVVIHAPECGFWKGADGETWILPSLNIPGDWIKGTAGAGDAFCAGILYGLHEGWNAMETLKLAVSNAAQCLSDPTTTGGLKSLAETLRLPNRFGFRTQLEL